MSGRFAVFLCTCSVGCFVSCNTYTHDLIGQVELGGTRHTTGGTNADTRRASGGASNSVGSQNAENGGGLATSREPSVAYGGANRVEGSSALGGAGATSVYSGGVGGTTNVGVGGAGGIAWATGGGGCTGTISLQGGASFGGAVSTASAAGGDTLAIGGAAITSHGSQAGSTATGGGGSLGGGIGLAGATATTTSTDPCAKIATTLVDDGADGDGNIYACWGRQGYWYSYAQNRDSQVASALSPAAGSEFFMNLADLTNFAAKLSANGNVNLGDCGFGLLFNTRAGGPKSTIALTSGEYITFRYRTSGLPNGKLRFQLLLKSTAATSDGGDCSGNGCNDHYSCALDATLDWRTVNVLLTSSTSGCNMGLAQSGAGYAVPLELSKVLGVQLNVASGVSGPFEVWLDDVHL